MGEERKQADAVFESLSCLLESDACGHLLYISHHTIYIYIYIHIHVHTHIYICEPVRTGTLVCPCQQRCDLPPLRPGCCCSHSPTYTHTHTHSHILEAQDRVEDFPPALSCTCLCPGTATNTHSHLSIC
jgi:hypothetical protein